MTTKKWVLLSLSAVPIVLAGCDSENLGEVQEATTEIERITDEAVADINQLAQTETELQELFSETLETDEELATLQDESSPVFENITAREEILADLEAVENDLETQQEILATYDGESLEQEQIQGVDTVVYDFEESLSTYVDTYYQTLEGEREFFAEISDEEATYDDFVNGIETLNEERESLREPLMNLDEILVDLDERLSELQSSIETELSEE
ncbi:Putative cell-wall binding lipoprotein [Alkalibacterium putridalgicola]|uniref:Putative cell-wall binding lipoprotein n=1 Tax=Alkalibacterium putridalgicola TaxID=426703 RepID=A0A1H7S6H1_9LACT|nr:YkyA family protein [Alkalibacterium putridalgicola]GEK89080.1 hypothetical protein APU01nite_11190 [Alkalibacterium putridalgicola]SEL68241.1 Putative cell-wall binding lipoprotein [Alkalibacterium putridalgicola]